MTLPVAGLGMLLSLVNDLREAAGKKSLDTGMVSIREPKNFGVGNSPMRRGQVFLTFDEKLPTETTYAIKDQDGRQLALMLERDVLSRMTMEERREALKQPPPVLLPGLGGGKLLLPRGR